MSSEQAGGTPGSAAVSDRMRALLSRAAEEQLLEQRQVSAVLGELRALVADVDERLATGEQVERVAAEVRALSARVEARLDATEARSAELEERVEARLSELTAGLTASVERSERRLATHVDDAVLALAEVVLRRRSAQGLTAAAAPTAAAGDDDPAVRAEVGDAQDSEAPATTGVAEDAGTRSPPVDTSTEQDELPPPPGPTAEDTDHDAAAPDEVPPQLVDPDTDGRVPAEPGPPGEGFVLVPADVEEPDAAPAPPVQQERRTAERRASERGDGSGRRRRPWWRPV